MSDGADAYSIDDARPEPLVRQVPGAQATSRSTSSTASSPRSSARRGCGKTTLLRCFNRVNERYGYVTTTGEIKILGKNIYDAGRLARRAAQVGRHGLPAPEPAADLGLRERRLRPAHPHAARASSTKAELDEAVEKALTEVGPVERPEGPAATRRRPALQLEQQQKLCIARLLPLKPEIILMDEPCSALDVEGTRAIEELMFELRGPLHDRDRHAQHGPGPPRQRRVHLHAAGRAHRAHAHRGPVPDPARPATAEYIEGRYG